MLAGRGSRPSGVNHARVDRLLQQEAVPRGRAPALTTARPDAAVLSRLPSDCVPTSRNLAPWSPSSRRQQCWGAALLFAKGGEVGSIRGLHPLPPAMSMAWGTPCPSAASPRVGNHSTWATWDVQRGERSPKGKGSCCWRKGGEEPAFRRSCRQKAWLEAGLGQRPAVAHLRCGHPSSAAPGASSPFPAGGRPRRGRMRAVPTAKC